MTARLLVVTAVEAEAEAVRAGCFPHRSSGPNGVVPPLPEPARIHIVAVGAGPAAAAAGAARLLALADAAGTPYKAVVSAGIGGGFPGRAPVPAVVVGLRSIAADLGAETPDGFLPIEELGFGTSSIAADKAMLEVLVAALGTTDANGPIAADILTVSTVTGSAATTAGLAARFPSAVAEAMEGYGVACAAAGAGVPFVEVRTIANPIGPRDRAAWRIPDALAALTAAARTFPTLLTVPDQSAPLTGTDQSRRAGDAD